MIKTNNLKITGITPLSHRPTCARSSRSPKKDREFVMKSRDRIKEILQRRDRRLMVVVGPCSIHDPDAAVEYAERLAALSHASETSSC